MTYYKMNRGKKSNFKIFFYNYMVKETLARKKYWDAL